MLKGVDKGDNLIQWQQKDERTGLWALETAMAWLSPQELAHLACTCHAMATAVRTLTHSRTADAAQGLERWPVPVVNRLDSCRYPWFRYTPFCCRSFSSAHNWGGEGEPSRKDFDVVKQESQEDLGIFPRSGILGNAVGCRRVLLSCMLCRFEFWRVGFYSLCTHGLDCGHNNHQDVVCATS